MKAEWTNADSLTASKTTKAILVIDMPTDCIKCPLADGYCWNVFPIKGKADGCPLKPMPTYDWHEEGKENECEEWYKNGWNDCIDAIISDTDGTKGEK